MKLIFAAGCLVAATVIVHAAGLVIGLRPIVRSTVRAESFWTVIWLVIRTVWWLIAIHLVEITLWALFYWWKRCFPDVESSLYFAGVTYTTLGYGDLVLPKEWRLLGPIEGLTGILMCGLSTGVFFAMASRIYQARIQTATGLKPPAEPMRR